MKMHEAKRIEIIIEKIMEKRLTDLLTEAGVKGYSVLPVSGGSGSSGRWSRQGQVSRAQGMSAVVCLVKPERLESTIDAVFPLLDRHIGVVSVTDTMVIRDELF